MIVYLKEKIGFLLFFLLFLSFNAHTLGVSPTYLVISPKEPITNLTLSNEGDSEITMQLELVEWNQYNGKDRYTPSDDLIITPQIFILPPHGEQLVRLGMEKPLFGPQEKAYRLFAQEVVPKTVRRKKGEIKIAVRLSLPVVITTPNPPVQQLVWRVESNKGATVKLRAENRGTNVLFINTLQIASENHQVLTKPLQTFAYILPGSIHQWVVKTSLLKKASLIKATVNGKAVYTHVT
ncbi:MAG: molecular chaperone [Legionellales bacterium]